MKSLLIALQFLTRLPIPSVGPWTKERLSGAARYFPVVGLGLGAILAVAYQLGSAWWPLPVVAVVVIALWVKLTGALHLDGLADAADGWMGGQTPAERLQVMRDPHVGAMGVIALILCLLEKWAFLASMPASVALAALLVAPVLGRWACVLASYRMPYARSEVSGWSRQFVEGLAWRDVAIATAIAGAISILILRWLGIFLWAGAGLLTYLLQWCWVRRFGGITGDLLGATCELTEIGCLLLLLSIS